MPPTPTTPASEPVLDRLRKLCLSFPNTSEVSSWGHPNFRAGKRTFAAFEHVKGRPSIAVRLNYPDVDLLLHRPQFFVTPYGRGRWVGMWVDDAPVDWNLVSDLLRRSYQVVAERAAGRRNLKLKNENLKTKK